MPLIRLSEVICVTLDWSGDHLHAFTGVPGENSHAGVNQLEFQLTVAGLLPTPSHASTCTYDFGDWWQVHLTLEKILTRPQRRTFYPRATAGRRAGPAEDCGGAPGYQHLLTALRARKGWRYQQAREQHPATGRTPSTWSASTTSSNAGTSTSNPTPNRPFSGNPPPGIEPLKAIYSRHMDTSGTEKDIVTARL
jgi:hypothetical protein